jgi:hypothetical protein
MDESVGVELAPESIVFHTYPFPGARVHPSGAVPWSEVVEVDPDGFPPEIRLAGETLFISGDRAIELRREAAAHGVPVASRVDVWGLLLEPFLDTTFSLAEEERTLAAIERIGIPRREAKRIRKRVEGRMLAYNAICWEWVHLGMWDLFQAHLPHPLIGAIFGDEAFRELYRWAQEIAHRARAATRDTPAVTP